ncbi:MAG: hypothetical protein EXX96DRAFT_41925 [Benjaminiella poitrasii]|nr:MAG: hypothetical protein EXX96DRAFT_41925 [Benjaminiella poitrasii]
MDTTAEVKTPPSRHYFYRKATQPDQVISPNNVNNVLLIGVESSNAFENRIDMFLEKESVQNSVERIKKGAAIDLNRRKAERKARKEKEEHHPANSENATGENTRVVVDNEHLEEDNNDSPKSATPLFEKLNVLSSTEHTAWLANIHDDALLMNPHQWLRLASLFNVNSKVSRQQSLLRIDDLDEVLNDRSIDENDVGPLENYMELRDIQNRNYARDAVAEGVRLIKLNRVKEAMEFYKRALDMDPKYAEVWFHVAEGLVHQKKLTEAAEHLERALKLDPDHEGAKALLANILHATNPKKATKDEEWDLVDDHGESIDKKIAEKRTSSKHDDEDLSEDKSESSRRRKKRRSTRRSRSREESSRRRGDDRRRNHSRDRSTTSRRRSRKSRSPSRDRSSRRNESTRRRHHSRDNDAENDRRERKTRDRDTENGRRESRAKYSDTENDKRETKTKDSDHRRKSPHGSHSSRRSKNRSRSPEHRSSKDKTHSRRSDRDSSRRRRRHHSKDSERSPSRSHRHRSDRRREDRHEKTESNGKRKEERREKAEINDKRRDERHEKVESSDKRRDERHEESESSDKKRST